MQPGAHGAGRRTRYFGASARIMY